MTKLYNLSELATKRVNALTHISNIDDVCAFYKLSQTALSETMGISRRHLYAVKHFRSPAGTKFIMGLCAVAPDEVGLWLPNIIRLYCIQRGRKSGKVQ